MCTGAVAVAAAASTCELPSQVKTIMYAASEASLSFNDEGHWKWETMLKVLPPQHLLLLLVGGLNKVIR